MADSQVKKWTIAVENIARVTHEANRALCCTLGDYTQVPWDSAPEWQKDSAREGVLFHLQGDYTAEDSHLNWCKQKVKDGWLFGEVKDAEKKTHPCLRPYDELPNSQKMKDHLFVSIVHAFKKEITRLQDLGIE